MYVYTTISHTNFMLSFYFDVFLLLQQCNLHWTGFLWWWHSWFIHALQWPAYWYWHGHRIKCEWEHSNRSPTSCATMDIRCLTICSDQGFNPRFYPSQGEEMLSFALHAYPSCWLGQSMSPSLLLHVPNGIPPMAGNYTGEPAIWA
jgi:hypothetical protein